MRTLREEARMGACETNFVDPRFPSRRLLRYSPASRSFVRGALHLDPDSVPQDRAPKGGR